MNTIEFKKLIGIIEKKAMKKYGNNYLGLFDVAIYIATHYFKNHYPIKKNFDSEEDFKLNQVEMGVILDLSKWLSHNYFNLTKPFKFKKSIKKWEEKIGYSRT